MTHRSVPVEWVAPLSQWCAELRLKGCTPATIKGWWYQISYLGIRARKSPLEITTVDLMAWLGRGVGNSSMRSDWSAASSFFDFLVKQGLRDDNPLISVPMVKRENRQLQPATEEAVKKGLASPDLRVRQLVTLLNDTGMRRTELVATTKHHLIMSTSGSSLMIHGKGNKDRVIPLSKAAEKIYLESPEGYIFPGARGHLHPDTAYALVKNATGWPLHSFRRKFATDVWRATGDVRKVQMLLGHESLATTQSYIFTGADDLRSAMTALDTYRHQMDRATINPMLLLKSLNIPESMASLLIQTIRESVRQETLFE